MPNGECVGAWYEQNAEKMQRRMTFKAGNSNFRFVEITDVKWASRLCLENNDNFNVLDYLEDRTENVDAAVFELARQMRQ